MLFKVSECNESKAGKHVDNIYGIVLGLLIVSVVKLGPVKNFVMNCMLWWIAFNQFSIWLFKNLRHQSLEFFAKLLENEKLVSALHVHVLSL